MKTKVDVCPKCKQKTALTRHHYRPLRIYGKKNNKEVLYICRPCHNFLEKFIPQREKMPDQFYFDIVKLFLWQI